MFERINPKKWIDSSDRRVGIPVGIMAYSVAFVSIPILFAALFFNRGSGEYAITAMVVFSYVTFPVLCVWRKSADFAAAYSCIRWDLHGMIIFFVYEYYTHLPIHLQILTGALYIEPLITSLFVFYNGSIRWVIEKSIQVEEKRWKCGQINKKINALDVVFGMMFSISTIVYVAAFVSGVLGGQSWEYLAYFTFGAMKSISAVIVLTWKRSFSVDLFVFNALAFVLTSAFLVNSDDYSLFVDTPINFAFIIYFLFSDRLRNAVWGLVRS